MLSILSFRLEYLCILFYFIFGNSIELKWITLCALWFAVARCDILHNGMIQLSVDTTNKPNRPSQWNHEEGFRVSLNCLAILKQSLVTLLQMDLIDTKKVTGRDHWFLAITKVDLKSISSKIYLVVAKKWWQQPVMLVLWVLKKQFVIARLDTFQLHNDVHSWRTIYELFNVCVFCIAVGRLLARH